LSGAFRVESADPPACYRCIARSACRMSGLRTIGGIQLAEGVRAEFWRLPEPPRSLEDRILKGIELFPCEALFIHRDAENESPILRDLQIRAAVLEAAKKGCPIPAVAIVPVRMLEAWLIFDERAIRQAAGNPNGTTPLNLPALKRMEDRPYPKDDLRDALKTASELAGRRLKKFNTAQAFWRVVDFLEDFSPLRQLPAFVAFESAVRSASENRWAAGFYGRDGYEPGLG
jgi:hypothetical protein